MSARSAKPTAIEPATAPPDARVTLPGSKSEANRALAAAALVGSEVAIHGVTWCDDVRRMADGLAALGYAVRVVRSGEHGDACEDDHAHTVHVGPRGAAPPGSGVLDCGNAGTALRFLVGVAAVTPGRWTLTGDAAMRTRPVGPLVDAWRALGAAVSAEGGCPPVVVEGVVLEGVGPQQLGARTRVDPSRSSQFVSSLLLAGVALARPLEVEFTAPPASLAYARLTVDVLAAFGVRAHVDERGARVECERGDVPRRYDVGGDWSAMGVWTCFAHLTRGRVRASNLRTGSGQADEALADVLRRFDEDVLRTGDGVRTLDVRTVPDQFMNLAVVAAARPGTTRFVGAANLRAKECDRLAVTARELTRLGVTVREHDDGLEVDGADALEPAQVDPSSDHRVAMAFALAGLLAPGIAIAEPECVAKSYPAFFDDLERVRAATAGALVVGHRAAGKSTFARALADELGRELIDTDVAFAAAHGSIEAFVAKGGWDAFRRAEARAIADALTVPGRVVALGGGALESGAVRELAAAHPVVVLVDTPLEVMRARLTAGDPARPSITGAAPVEELEALAERREAALRRAADLVVDGTADPRDEARRLVRRLRARCRWPGAMPC